MLLATNEESGLTLNIKKQSKFIKFLKSQMPQGNLKVNGDIINKLKKV